MRAFDLCKDSYFFEYMGCKNESYQEGDIPTPSVTVENILNFALEKYTDLSWINNHVWGSSFKREAKFVTLAAEVTTLNGNMNLAEKIAKNQNPNRGGGGASAKYRTGDKHKYKKEKEARLAL